MSTPGSDSKSTKKAKKDAKKETTNKKSTSITYNKCPCGKSDDSSWVLTCTRCPQSWHSNCSNLKGISEQFVTELEDWLCPLCFCAPGVTARNNQQIEMVLDSMVELRDSNTSLQTTVSALEDKLSSLISESDQVRSTNLEMCKKLPKLDDIEHHIQHRTLQEGQVNHKLKCMGAQLSELQASVQAFKESASSSAPPVHTPMPPTFDPASSAEPPFVVSEIPATIIEDYIDDQMSKPIIDFLKMQTYANENGHSVTAFGHPYTYTGSKSSSDVPPIPSELEPLFQKLNALQADQFYQRYPDLKSKGCAPVLNSCLVNRYSGPDGFLSEHSDNEPTINPESSIFCISLGESCVMKYADMSGKTDDHEVTCKPNSMYHMTCKSQQFFTHRIEKGSVAQGIRYSLTFRCVNWRNRNATCIIGDSNTGKLAFGNSKFNSFSELMPGQRFWAAGISEIDPGTSCGYNNVVVSVGINDLKQRDVNCQRDIDMLYHRYKAKIKLIRQLNAKINIFVVPILPTKNYDLNRRANYFNSLIFNDLQRSNLGVTPVVGLDSFVDGDGLLSEKMSKQFDNNGRRDVLHLNESGVRRFAGMIKRAVFLKLNRGVDKRKVARPPVGAQGAPPGRVAGRGWADG